MSPSPSANNSPARSIIEVVSGVGFLALISVFLVVCCMVGGFVTFKGFPPYEPDPTEGPVVPIETLLIDNSVFPIPLTYKDEIEDRSVSPLGWTTSQDFRARSFLGQSEVVQIVRRFTTKDEASGNFAFSIEGVGKNFKQPLPRPLDTEIIAANEWHVMCINNGTVKLRCLFFARYGIYSTQLFANIDESTMTFEDFAHIVHAIDQKMAPVATKRQPTPSPR